MVVIVVIIIILSYFIGSDCCVYIIFKYFYGYQFKVPCSTFVCGGRIRKVFIFCDEVCFFPNVLFGVCVVPELTDWEKKLKLGYFSRLTVYVFAECHILLWDLCKGLHKTASSHVP